MTKTVSAVVLDDHPLSASGVADFLRSHCGFEQAWPVSNTAEFWRILNDGHPPALAVVDFWLPEGAALPLLAQMKREYPATRLLAVSADDSAAVADKVRAAGADGFFHKQEAPAIFGRAVAALLHGDAWFPSGRAGPEPPPKEWPVTAAELGLTVRQGQVLGMILKGLPNKRIALNLSLSEQTVKEHVSGILERLGARNRVEVITQLRGKTLDEP